jgi:DnaJ-class molecular chaperone
MTPGDCRTCAGTGKVQGESCAECHGTGYRQHKSRSERFAEQSRGAFEAAHGIKPTGGRK